LHGHCHEGNGEKEKGDGKGGHYNIK
jgi:hypothetical protein